MCIHCCRTLMWRLKNIITCLWWHQTKMKGSSSAWNAGWTVRVLRGLTTLFLKDESMRKQNDLMLQCVVSLTGNTADIQRLNMLVLCPWTVLFLLVQIPLLSPIPQNTSKLCDATQCPKPHRQWNWKYGRGDCGSIWNGFLGISFLFWQHYCFYNTKLICSNAVWVHIVRALSHVESHSISWLLFTDDNAKSLASF